MRFSVVLSIVAPVAALVVRSPTAAADNVREHEIISLPQPTVIEPTLTKRNAVATPSPVQAGMDRSCDRFYQVKTGDDCDTISDANKISWAYFYDWNPAVGIECQGLRVGYYVCVGTVGFGVTTTSAATLTTPTPVQTGIATNCDGFYSVKSGDACPSIASAAQIPLPTFFAWNPAVGTECQGLLYGFHVCTHTVGFIPTTTLPGNGVSTPAPIQTGVVSSCNKFYKVQPGDGCETIAKSNSVSLDAFLKWNPAVGSGCANMFADYYVCVSVLDGSGTVTTTQVPTTTGNGITTPTPYQTGMANNCKTFHLVVAGDNCEKIAKLAGVSLDVFYGWNPALGSSCTSLWLDTYVCIATI